MLQISPLVHGATYWVTQSVTLQKIHSLPQQDCKASFILDSNTGSRGLRQGHSRKALVIIISDLKGRQLLIGRLVQKLLGQCLLDCSYALDLQQLTRLNRCSHQVQLPQLMR